MQVASTSLTHSLFPINEYNLEGGVIIRDKTNGIGKAVFSSKLTEEYQKSAYNIFINDKKLIYPTFSDFSLESNITFIAGVFN